MVVPSQDKLVKKIIVEPGHGFTRSLGERVTRLSKYKWIPGMTLQEYELCCGGNCIPCPGCMLKRGAFNAYDSEEGCTKVVCPRCSTAFCRQCLALWPLPPCQRCVAAGVTCRCKQTIWSTPSCHHGSEHLFLTDPRAEQPEEDDFVVRQRYG